MICNRQRLGDRLADLVLDGKDIDELAIVGFRPQVVAIGDLDQLRGNAHAVALLSDRALQQMGDAELLADHA